MATTLDLLRRLAEGGVPFVVVGGIAAVAHGSSVVTDDLDVCAPLAHDDAVRIIRALAGTSPRWRTRPDLPVVTPDSPGLRGLRNIYLRTDLGALDVLGQITGLGGFAEVQGLSSHQEPLVVAKRGGPDRG